MPSLEIRSGELFTFVGPSGSGKSSILKVIAGVEQPSSGTVAAGGQVLNDLARDSRGVALVEAADVLDPGSQPISLFDDPLRGAEPAERGRQQTALVRLHDDLGTTFVYATEDQAEALAISDRLAVLHDGQIQQVGTPAEIFEVPANAFVASYFGAPPMNVVPGILEKDGQAIQIGNRVVPLKLHGAGQLRPRRVAGHSAGARSAPTRQPGWLAWKGGPRRPRRRVQVG